MWVRTYPVQYHHEKSPHRPGRRVSFVFAGIDPALRCHRHPASHAACRSDVPSGSSGGGVEPVAASGFRGREDWAVFWRVRLWLERASTQTTSAGKSCFKQRRPNGGGDKHRFQPSAPPVSLIRYQGFMSGDGNSILPLFNSSHSWLPLNRDICRPPEYFSV